MRPLRRGWITSRQRLYRRLMGVGVGLSGAVLIIKIFPLWLWPLGVGLWLVWSGLGPILIGAAMIWAGWRLVSTR